MRGVEVNGPGMVGVRNSFTEKTKVDGNRWEERKGKEEITRPGPATQSPGQRGKLAVETAQRNTSGLCEKAVSFLGIRCLKKLSGPAELQSNSLTCRSS